MWKTTEKKYESCFEIELLLLFFTENNASYYTNATFSDISLWSIKLFKKMENNFKYTQHITCRMPYLRPVIDNIFISYNILSILFRCPLKLCQDSASMRKNCFVISAFDYSIIVKEKVELLALSWLWKVLLGIDELCCVCIIKIQHYLLNYTLWVTILKKKQLLILSCYDSAIFCRVKN